ncbi:agmatinase [Limoniibacter endophyticus]|uniref:Agmatinase n=1 Tax=Limoniibacter endophyticus TaxID=1565040 RepID=A0A8J3DL35_9HYPH|nr:agmatinase [Limoniibacter endophyticus]GHC79121.1 agmatinase [Limoniibacter endophyticus]
MPSTSIDNAFVPGPITGAASDPTYAGALSFMRRKFSKRVAGADVIIWGIPFDSAVSNRPGARFGPQAMRRASTIFDNDPQYPFERDLFDKLAVIDYGDFLHDYGYPNRVPRLVEKEAAKLLRTDALLISLGGDHSVTYPLLKAHAARHGPLALVHFDAHQDTWPDDGKRVDHGSFVTRAVREGLIVPDYSIQIGIRTHAPESHGIRIVHGYELEDMTVAEIATAIERRVDGRQAYITFDIDCLDPAFAPGTGTPVAGGPSSAKMLGVLRRLTHLHIVGADIVEVSPPYDHADITAIAGATVAMHYLGLAAERKVRRKP